MTGIAFGRNEATKSARRSLSQYISDAKIERPVSEGPGAALALISLIVIVACVGAAIALTQIRSLKSEITALHRELAPLKERVAQLDQAEKARRQAEQEEDAKDKSAIERSNRMGETQAALNLSSEEIQLDPAAITTHGENTKTAWCEICNPKRSDQHRQER